jgi:hypothetical protein
MLKAVKFRKRGLLKWIPFVGLTCIFCNLPEHAMFVAIALILLVDMGFTFPAVDQLAAYSNRFHFKFLRESSSRKK